MPRRRKAASLNEDQIRNLSQRFAADIVRIVRSGVADEVAAQVSAVLDGIARGGGRVSVGGPSGDRRIGKSPVPVQCPVPGCKNPGIRAKRNFCGEHSTSLSESEKARYRDAQLSAKKGGAEGKKPARAKKRGKKEKA